MTLDFQQVSVRTNLLAGFVIVAFASTIVRADNRVDAKDLKPIGGHWFVSTGETPTYHYQDGERFVDLFSYHTKDSNKDGVDNLKLSHDEKFLIVQSQGYPNHPTAVFPNTGNPNSIRVQNFNFRLPLQPALADEITRLPMGAIGMALNGVVFFNPFEMEGMNAVEGYSEVWLDSCCGHPQQSGVYHYHKYPSCVKSPFAANGKQHSPIIGFGFDGFPVYGSYEGLGEMATDLKDDRALDVCNGHKDDVRGYHYHVTPGQFPYIIGGYAGIVEASNNRGLCRVGSGAIVDNTQPGTRMEQVIDSVRPGTVARGKTHSINFELIPENAKRRAIPTEQPSWAQIGPFEATKISREGNTVVAETGELVYGERVAEIKAGGRPVYASPVIANCNIYSPSRKDGVLVLPAKPTYSIIAQNQFTGDDSDFNATPAISDNQMFICSNSFLYCVANRN